MTKRKNLTLIFTALVVVLAVVIMGLFCGTTLQASAATTSLYNIRFSYTAYRGVYISTATTVQASGTNVLQSDEIQCSKFFRFMALHIAEQARLTMAGILAQIL